MDTSDNRYWNNHWNKLPAGLKFTRTAIRATDVQPVMDAWLAQPKVWNGNPTPYDLGFGHYPMSQDYMTAYAAALDDAARFEDIKITSRADAVLLYHAAMALATERENHMHPTLHRPGYSLASLFGEVSDLEQRMDVYLSQPNGPELIRCAIRDRLRSWPFRLDDTVTLFLESPSVGIRETEKAAAIKSLIEGRTPSAADDLQKLWLQAGGQSTEFSGLWSPYAAGLEQAERRVRADQPRHAGPWGREALTSLLSQLFIPHSPEAVLQWATAQADALETALNEVAFCIDPSARDWRQVVDEYPFDIPENDDALLALHQATTPTVMQAMRANGLIPGNAPRGCSFVVGFTPASDEATVPTGACRPAGRSGKKRVSRLIVTQTRGNKDLMRKHAFMRWGLIAHEGTHAWQGFYKPTVPYSVEVSFQLSLLAFEGNAFGTERLAWQLGAIPRDLINLLYVLSGRIQRAERVVFELGYHLGSMDLAAGIRRYAERSRMTIEDATADCERAMATPGSFSGYYFGAAMAEVMAELSGLGHVRMHNEWLAKCAALIHPALWSFMNKWVNNPNELLATLPADAGVTMWEQARNEFVPMSVFVSTPLLHQSGLITA